MDDFDGMLLFFVAIIVICLIFFGFISTVQKSFKKVPTYQSPLSDKAGRKLKDRIDAVNDQQDLLMEQQKEKINDLKRQSETSLDQLKERNKDMQQRQRQQLEDQQQRLRDMQRR